MSHAKMYNVMPFYDTLNFGTLMYASKHSAGLGQVRLGQAAMLGAKMPAEIPTKMPEKCFKITCQNVC